ncbi:NAD(P)H-dependent oxidoreductase [Mariniluteicoccus endophyticus]
MKIGIIIGSTRPGRAGESVGRWVHEIAVQRDDAAFELVDLADYDLALLEEPTVPGAANRQYASENTRRWSEKIDELDGFVFVTPEYNNSVPAAFKNAVDVLYPEWNNKAVAFVGYGADGAVRAVEHWRGITANVYLKATRAQVSLSLFTDFGDQGFQPGERRAAELTGVLDELVPLTKACTTLRS